MSAIFRISAVVGLLATTIACSSSDSHQDRSRELQTVTGLDVPRYMATWYEVAKFPNWFQAKCVAATSADYSLQQDGTIKVVNRCRRATGEMDEAVGTARQVGPAKLKVRFAPWWLSWLPAVWGDYWVIDLDQDYKLVAISEPTREYLWVLSRTPIVEPAAYQALLGRLRAQGFDLSKLEATKH